MLTESGRVRGGDRPGGDALSRLLAGGRWVVVSNQSDVSASPRTPASFELLLLPSVVYFHCLSSHDLPRRIRV